MARSKEQIADYHRRYYRQHRDEQLRRCRQYYAAHRDELVQRARERRMTHKEEFAECKRRYYEAHRDHILETRRKYYRANREKILARVRAARQPVGGRPLRARVAYLLENPEEYIWEGLGIELRPYQVEPLGRILESIEGHLGDTVILMFPRQSGKDEFLLDLLIYLADLYATEHAGIVVVNPTFKPQTVTALQRFDASLDANQLTRGTWRRHGGFMRIIGQARISFLSGEPHASVTGATASLLLVVNEAQDISPEVYYRKLVPMAASMNATRILAGTAWTSQTLLAQEMRLARFAEETDGRRRVFTIDADGVRQSAPWYGQHVDAIVRSHGRGHPLVKTQYFNEEIDAEIGMFPPARRAMMFGPEGPPIGDRPEPGKSYAFCIDVAGQDESAMSSDPRLSTLDVGVRHLLTSDSNGRDATTLSIVYVDLSTLETLQAPTYRVVHRLQWTALSHLTIFGQLKALAELWQPQQIVIDATGVGEGLWAMLDKAFPRRLIPVKFSAEKKSEIGYRFISIIETGRFKAIREERESRGENREFIADSRGSGHRVVDSRGTVNRQPSTPLVSILKDERAGSTAGLVRGGARVPSQAQVEREYAACRAEVLPGPRKTMRWGVPDGARDENGLLIHDDIVLADALIAELDNLPWSIHYDAFVIPGRDPLEEMSHIRTAKT